MGRWIAAYIPVYAAIHHHAVQPRRAVLLMRDALGFPALEVADLLDSSPAAVNRALQQARATMAAALPASASGRRCPGQPASATWRSGSRPPAPTTTSTSCWHC